ncbi:MAG TPA: cytosine permease [Vicinamibacterales bacterium]|nr:cytosine permease [Vicinamibacterales bacterium]
MKAADIRPVPVSEQQQSATDLFLIFVGANVVATTFQVGASLAASFSLSTTLVLIALGSVAGAALVAALAPLGSRLRVPSVIAARPALGMTGAGLVAVLLYVSNFAWIALNNVIAASACARAAAAWIGPAVGAQTPWAIALGVLSTAVVWRGPRAVARADRVAVPLMLAVTAALTVACVYHTRAVAALSPTTMSWARGFDVVIGYQVSWILMFADFSRYTRSPGRSTSAVFAALASTSIWLMPLGAVAARAAGSVDPGAMLDAVGLGAAGALLLALATVTTNFVNIYMSSLAWKSLTPRAGDAAVIWSIGIVGTLLSALPGVWLEQYTNFMVILGGALVPIGGLLVAHYYIRPARIDEALVGEMYEASGPFRGVAPAGFAAWTIGAVVYFVAGRTGIGGTAPALASSIIVYALAAPRTLNVAAVR